MRKVLLLAGLALAACATNPATGRSQLILISEAQELALGQQEDRSTVASYGVYPDAELAGYVEGIAQRLAAASERPSLPWAFRLLDDPVVNAFALPAHVYVTRGILAHMGSEAQLAGVLGHEIGHVTARHTASRLSKAQLAGLGLGVGSLLSEDVARFSGLAQAGLGLLFLDFSRNDEREADALGLRYMTRVGYDGRELVEVFRMLERTTPADAGGRLPGWLSTHPTPADREERLRQAIEAAGGAGGRVERDGFLRRLDGLVFGEDPREGYFVGDSFHHPELRFRLELPRGYTKRNTRQSVSALGPEQDAAVTLTLAEGGSSAAALDAFLARDGLRHGAPRRLSLGGLAAAEAEFEATTDGGLLRGRALCVEHEQRVYRLLGYAVAARWDTRAPALDAALRSFRPERERRYLDVEPARLAIVTLERPTSLAEFGRRFASDVALTELARLNGVSEAGMLPAGLAKRVVGGRLPR